MCGIIGIKSCVDISTKIIEKLKILEYRGYDSAGVSYLKDKLYCKKSVGKVDKLAKKIDCHFDIGIAHTRWATHGKPTLHNCHPFLSSDKNVAIVHNGIINNYIQIKNELSNKNVVFDSETDSEVIAKLFDNKTLTIDSIRKVCQKLNGSYAIVGLTATGILFGAKKGSPLYFAQNKDEFLIASDIACFEGADSFFTLQDGEYVIVDKKVQFFDDEKIIEKISTQLDFDKYKYAKTHENFMIQEILQTPTLVKRYLLNQQKLNINKYKNVYLFGCGSAYHCAKIGEHYLRQLNKNCKAIVASEIGEEKCDFDNALCIFLSQSGETIDTLNALSLCKGKATTVALINNEFSTLARECDIIVPINAQKEFSVASTKAVTMMIVAMLCWVKEQSYNDYKKVFNINENVLKELANKLYNNESLFFVGKGIDHIINCEGALKVKEIAYINANAYLSGELKHGPLALIDEKAYVIVSCSQKRFVDKTKSTICEIKARGGKIVLFTPFVSLIETLDNEDYSVLLPNITGELVPISALYSYQLLSYYICKNRGLNPDFPRNLAKSVTVE